MSFSADVVKNAIFKRLGKMEYPGDWTRDRWGLDEYEVYARHENGLYLFILNPYGTDDMTVYAGNDVNYVMSTKLLNTSSKDEAEEVMQEAMFRFPHNPDLQELRRAF